MGEKLISIDVPESIGKGIEASGKDLRSWWHEALTLGLLVNKGCIFQDVGGRRLRLNMQDINPISEPLQGEATMVRHFDLGVRHDIYSEIELLFPDVDDWCRRAAALRYRAENMRLVFFNGRDHLICDING